MVDSLTHNLPNGLLVCCAECEKYSVPYDSEPCKTCIANREQSFDRETPLTCFFSSKTPDEHKKLEGFVKEYSEIIQEMYHDSITLKIPMDRLPLLWEYRDILRKYCGENCPVDIFKEADKWGISREIIMFQLKNNIRLLTGKASYKANNKEEK